jgi:putative membrane protein
MREEEGTEMRIRRVYTLLTAGVIAGTLALGLALPGLAQDQGPAGPPFGPHRFGPMPYGPHPFGPWAWVAGLSLLLRLLLVTGLILLIWRALTTQTIWRRPDSALQILRERFARGEISEDEYHKRAATLA